MLLLLLLLLFLLLLLCAKDSKKYRIVEEALLMRFEVALKKDALKNHGAEIEQQLPSGASEADLRTGIIARYASAAILGTALPDEGDAAVASPPPATPASVMARKSAAAASPIKIRRRAAASPAYRCCRRA